MKSIICKKCREKNILDASYCICCGNKFTSKEKRRARRFTFVGILETIDKINDIGNLSIITKNKIFRILSVIIVIFIGVANIYTNGNHIKLTQSDNYSIKHFNDTYYVLLDSKKTILDLYIPKKIDYLEVELVDNNESVSTSKIELNEKVELLSNDEDSYYLINGISNNKKEIIKVKLVYEEKNEK